MHAILKDYQGKYDEFLKAIKKSRETMKKYEKEVRRLNSSISELEKKKRD